MPAMKVGEHIGLDLVKDARSQGVSVSGTMLQQKTKDYSLLLHFEGFEASSGWLYESRERNCITCQAVCREG